jgi:hypothetical protein
MFLVENLVTIGIPNRFSKILANKSKPDTSNLKIRNWQLLQFLENNFKFGLECRLLHSNFFSPETSRISPVSAQPKLRAWFRMFFVKPEVSVSQVSVVDSGLNPWKIWSLKKAKRKFWNMQFVLPTLSKINQKQNKIDISI